MDLSIRSLSKLATANQDQRFEIVEIGVEEGVDLGLRLKKKSLPNSMLWGGGTLLFFHVV
jgi:hypothetical protein